MQIVSFNVNGVRSALTKGFRQWVDEHRPDVLCLQEVKADAATAMPIFESVFPEYQTFYAPAEKKGYSGVATLVREKPGNVVVGCGVTEYDSEGRVLRVDLDGISVLNTYFPSGTTGEVRQAVKDAFLQFYRPYVQGLWGHQPNLVAVGDFNIAHTEDDIHNPKMKGVSGYLPHERAWMSDLVADGWTDSYRHLYPTGKAYSWWSQRAGARAKNLGWRLDYAFVTQGLRDRVAEHRLHTQAMYSDHCPVALTLR